MAVGQRLQGKRERVGDLLWRRGPQRAQRQPLVDIVTGIVDAANAGGHTILPAFGGFGRNGRWREDRFTAADIKLLLLAVEQLTPEHIEYMRSRIPRGRLLEVDEAAAMVAWLVSKENSFTTASTFDLSGGHTTY